MMSFWSSRRTVPENAEVNAHAQANQLVLRRVNRLITRRHLSFLSRHSLGQNFKQRMLAAEGAELSGLDEFSLDNDTRKIHMRRLRSATGRIEYMIANREVCVRQFETVADEDAYIVLDLTRSMRYPLRQLYGDGDVKFEEPDVLNAKPTLLKLAAGCLATLAASCGFSIRIVTFGQGRIKELPAIRNYRGLGQRLNRLIDERFLELTKRQKQSGLPKEEPQYGRVIDQLRNRKGIFMFFGDFLDPLEHWKDPAAQVREIRLLRQLSRDRRVIVVRTNHQREVMHPHDLVSQTRQVHTLDDYCYIGAEGPMGWEAKDAESTRNAWDRLTWQQDWEKQLHLLLSPCRAVLSIRRWPVEGAFMREYQAAWRKCVGQ